jgi:hypothetical protein
MNTVVLCNDYSRPPFSATNHGNSGIDLGTTEGRIPSELGITLWWRAGISTIGTHNLFNELEIQNLRVDD